MCQYWIKTYFSATSMLDNGSFDSVLTLTGSSFTLGMIGLTGILTAGAIGTGVEACLTSI